MRPRNSATGHLVGEKDGKFRKLPLTQDQLPKAGRCGKVCTNKSSLTIPLRVASKQAQQGPGWATQAWARVYHKGRNIIESRNQLLKGAGGSAIGDRTSRMVRGFSKQWLVIAVAAVAVNVRLIDSYLRRAGKELTPVPPTPPEPTRKTSRDAVAEPGWANAPPAAA